MIIYFVLGKMKCIPIPMPEFAKIMQDISQEKRLQILCMLAKEERLCVCEIIEKLGIKQNLVSHHLKVLKELGLVVSEQEWKKIYYSINTEKYNEFKNNIKRIFNI